MSEKQMPAMSRCWAIDAYRPTGALTLQERALPAPGGGEIVIALEAVALNPLDLKIMSGAMARFMPVAFPFTPGSDAVGRIVALGAGVRNFSLGDRVVAVTLRHGAMAEHMALASDGAVARAPGGLSARDLAALPEAGLTALAIGRALGDVQGRRVAVIGASGGIGLYLVQMLKRAGAHIVATARPAAAATVREAGAAETVDYAGRDVMDALKQHRPAGYDAVVDLIHQFQDLLRAAALLRDGGLLVSTLFGPESSDFPSSISVAYIRLAPNAKDLEDLVQALDTGALKSHLHRAFPFEEAPAAYAALKAGSVIGKIVVDVAAR